MADNAVPTLAPEQQVTDVRETIPAKPYVDSLNTGRESLFDSIVQEGLGDEEDSQSPRLKQFFSGLLWFGYAVAIIVALALVWSVASRLLDGG